jgi:predicted dehydrogenase
MLIEDIPAVQPSLEGHNAIIGQFLDWLDGGPEPPTTLADNLKSMAMVFGAIQASAAGQIVDVEALVPSASS